MGVIISRFRRKETTSQILERLDSKIKSIEEDGLDREQRRKKVTGFVMAFSVALYVLFALLTYYKGWNQNWLQSLLYASPLVVGPIFVLLLCSAISGYFNWALNKNRIKLNKMREEKKKILEEVMNTETYKVAKEILDKYGSPEDQSKALKPFVPTQNVPGNGFSPPNPATPGQLRLRQVGFTSTPISKQFQTNSNAANNTPALYRGSGSRPERLPRPILDKNRSAFDKVVDYLLKDGPSHRMALICKECFSHNGMAMVEEYEYLTYSCAYCGKLNPAKKQRPVAPNLSYQQRIAVAGGGDDSSLASNSSDSEDDKYNHKEISNCSSSQKELDRPPSPADEAPKSSEDKK